MGTDTVKDRSEALRTVNRRVRLGAAVVLSLLLSVTVPATGQTQGSTAVFETREALGDAAVSVNVQAMHATFCDFHVMLAGAFPPNGVVDRLYYAEWADGQAHWLHGAPTQSVYAHMEGVVDTRSTKNNLWVSEAWFLVTVRSEVTLTFTGPQLMPWPSSAEDGPEHSVRISVECNDHASFSLSGSREVVLLSTANAPNGAGVGTHDEDGVLPRAEGVLFARTGGDFTAPDVRMRAGTEGMNLGSLLLGRPDETAPQPWVLESGEKKTIMADGGPGEYGLMLNRFGDRNGFWALLAGWYPVEDLDEVADLPGF